MSLHPVPKYLNLNFMSSNMSRFLCLKIEAKACSSLSFFCHTAMIEKQNYLPGMTQREVRRQEKLNDAKKSDASEKACGC